MLFRSVIFTSGRRGGLLRQHRFPDQRRAEKGDPKRATEAIGQVEFGEIDEADGTGEEAPQE